MASGMWTAVSGAAAQAQHVDVIANNLANTDTQGYKKDLPSFREYLATEERDRAPGGIPVGPIRDKDLYPLDGRDTAHVVVEGTYVNLRQGPLKVSKSPLDVALDGPGFLEVNTPAGVRFTRNGSLKLAMDGRLVTSDGHPVLAASAGGLAGQTGDATRQPAQAANGEATNAARFISLRDRPGNVSITESGEIYAGDELIAKLSVVEFKNPNQLRKAGSSLFDLRPNDPARPVADPNAPTVVASAQTVVRQGMIEGSNVNPVEEMTNMIKANRMFEQDMKSLKTFNDLMGREANDIGKL